jgi:hypothetical protein
MTMRLWLFALTVPLVLGSYAASDADKADLKSGPQAGDKLPGPIFYSEEPRSVGTKTDFTEMFGSNPVILILAREMTKPLSRLVKKLHAEVAKRKSARLRSVLVILSDEDALDNKLKEYGKKQKIKHVDLAIMEPDGPSPGAVLRCGLRSARHCLHRRRSGSGDALVVDGL